MLGSLTGLQSYNSHQNIGRQVEQLQSSDVVAPVNNAESPNPEDVSLSSRRNSYLAIAAEFDVTSLKNQDLMGFRNELFRYGLINFPQANIITLASAQSAGDVDLPKELNLFFEQPQNQKYLPLKQSLMSTVGNLTAAREENR